MSVTARGGYQIVDFHDIIINAGTGPINIPGIHEQIVNTNGKPCLVSNLKIHLSGMSEGFYMSIPAQYVNNIVENAGTYTFNLNSDDTIIKVLIAADDNVLITEISD